MTEVKKSSARRWILVFQAPLVVIGVGAFAAVASDLIDVSTGLTVFLAALIASIMGFAWYMKSCRCPDCGQTLLPPRGWWHRFPGAPIPMRCARCNVDWDLGLRGHQD
jgi:hypothetical protein